MPPLRTALATSALTLATLLTTGCESVLYAYANRGLAPPDATVAYAPEIDLALDVYRPRTAVVDAPTVVFFYGGNWRRGERGQYQFVGRRLADSGILAIVADYRAGAQPGFPAFMDDAARAVAWAREHASEHGGDPRRLYVAGHSAGAQIAALLATDGRYLAAHGLQPGDLAGAIGLSGPYDFVVGDTYRDIFGPPVQWPRAQAVNFVDGDEPPFLLIHGSDDRVVEARDSVQLAEKLHAHGVSAELVLLPEAGHGAPLLGLYDPQRAPRVLPAILAFLR